METTEVPEIATTDQRKLPEPAKEDRISYLPDEILSHILSFLQTKNAVATSALSRRWKDLWTGVYNLDLDFKYRYGGTEIRERRCLEFCRFVDRVLSQHKNLNSLRRFRFHFAMTDDDCKAMSNLWLKMGLAPDESQLEEMDVKLEVDYCIRDQFSMRGLPESFYRLKNLKILKLAGITVETTTKGSMFLPSVKILQLFKVVTTDWASLSELISGCPVLESLHMEDCDSSNREENHKLIAFLPCLKKLSIIGIRFHDFPLCSIAMEAPSLEQLYLEDFPEMQLLESNRPLPCLHSATVEFGRSEISNEGLTRVLAQISNAKEMRLSSSLLCLLSNDNGDVQLPIFPNLTRLKIGSPGSSCILHSVLNSVPKLQSLIVNLEDGRGTMEWEDFNDHGCTPECLLSSLEEVKIEDLIADKGEMEMVACLLEAGVTLKKAHVHIVYDDADVYEEYGDYLKAIHNRLGSLVKLLRSSRGCEAHLFLPFGDEIHVCSDDETHGNDVVDGLEDGDANVDDGRTDNDNDSIICDGNDGEKRI